MAKKNRILIRLVSTLGTGVFYTTVVNPKNQEEKEKRKLELKKYDWKARKHVLFKQEKIK